MFTFFIRNLLGKVRKTNKAQQGLCRDTCQLIGIPLIVSSWRKLFLFQVYSVNLQLIGAAFIDRKRSAAFFKQGPTTNLDPHLRKGYRFFGGGSWSNFNEKVISDLDNWFRSEFPQSPTFHEMLCKKTCVCKLYSWAFGLDTWYHNLTHIIPTSQLTKSSVSSLIRWMCHVSYLEPGKTEPYQISCNC